jgi:15-hydroxyprostaglandin dehydrogenase (NAD)
MAVPKVAIVTGGAGGIGTPMSRFLINQGYHVVIADINPEAGRKAQEILGPSSLFVQCDLTDWNSHASMFKKAFDWHGRVDLCVANAGVTEKEAFYEKPDIDQQPSKPNLTVVDLDLVAVIYGLKLFRYYWRKSGNDGVGKLIITSSMAGIYAFAAAPLYCAAKHGVSSSRSRQNLLLMTV